jgi:hypothetical protein
MTETTNHPTADGQPPKSKPTTDASNENGAGPLLKKPDVLRDPQGRFERHGKALSKTAKVKNSNNLAGIKNSEKFIPVNKVGRPKGSKNKVTLALKEAILAAGEEVGNELDGNGLTSYLKTLARENSSAYAGLLGKVLPSTLAVSDSDGGKQALVTFQRIIVWPDGHKEIEGVTPKQLPKPVIEPDEKA